MVNEAVAYDAEERTRLGVESTGLESFNLPGLHPPNEHLPQFAVTRKHRQTCVLGSEIPRDCQLDMDATFKHTNKSTFGTIFFSKDVGLEGFLFLSAFKGTAPPPSRQPSRGAVIRVVSISWEFDFCLGFWFKGILLQFAWDPGRVHRKGKAEREFTNRLKIWGSIGIYLEVTLPIQASQTQPSLRAQQVI